MNNKLFVLVIAGTILACEDQNDDLQCARVRYSIEYCAEQKPLHLVEFLDQNSLATPITSGNSTRYLAAISELPTAVQKSDTVFYLYFHRDRKLAKELEPRICQAMFSPVNILICDKVSGDPCDIPITK